MLEQKLRKLRLAHAASIVEAHHQTAISEKLGYLEFLERLLNDELESRTTKSVQKRMRAAHFPVLKTLEEFDFSFQPKLDAKQIKALASCEFIEKHENVLLIGPPGVGKSHLATAIAVKACLRGYSVRSCPRAWCKSLRSSGRLTLSRQSRRRAGAPDCR